MNGIELGPWARRLLETRLVQPDDRSCGASCLVVARAVTDEAYAELLVRGIHPRSGFVALGATPEDRFRGEALAMHRRVTGPVDARGRLQLPYPRVLGTPPWAVAHQLSRRGVRFGVRQALLARRSALEEVADAVAAGVPVPLYVGTPLAPRHVVLALAVDGSGLTCYNPSVGGLVTFASEEFAEGRLPGRWPTPWFVVRPS